MCKTILSQLWMTSFCIHLSLSAPVVPPSRPDLVLSQEDTTANLLDVESAKSVQVDMDQAKHYLAQYGYIDNSRKGVTTSASQLPQEHLVVDPLPENSLRNALKRFQAMAGLPQTGELDKDTQEMMAMPRCGFPDHGPTTVPQLNNKRRKRFLVSGSSWSVHTIRYNVGSFPREDLNLSQVEVMSTVRQALKFWSDASSLSFVETTSKDADIQMNFFVGDHGDISPFNGPGRVLAHASYPIRGGDLHWDGDETWTVNSNTGRSLLYVTTHELGHALGLAHSDKRNAIMAPFYKRLNPNLKLSQDDVDGIQNIYGPPSSAAPAETTDLISVTILVDGSNPNGNYLVDETSILYSTTSSVESFSMSASNTATKPVFEQSTATIPTVNSAKRVMSTIFVKYDTYASQTNTASVETVLP